MPFEKFDRSKAVYGRKPNVTIQARGIISINQSAYRRMGSPGFVDLYFDPESNRIGIQGTTDADSGLNVRVADQPGAAAVIGGTSFTKYYDIDTRQSRRWEPEFEGDMLIIDLNTEGRLTGFARKTEDSGNESSSNSKTEFDSEDGAENAPA